MRNRSFGITVSIVQFLVKAWPPSFVLVSLFALTMFPSCSEDNNGDCPNCPMGFECRVEQLSTTQIGDSLTVFSLIGHEEYVLAFGYKRTPSMMPAFVLQVQVFTVSGSGTLSFQREQMLLPADSTMRGLPGLVSGKTIGMRGEYIYQSCESYLDTWKFESDSISYIGRTQFDVPPGSVRVLSLGNNLTLIPLQANVDPLPVRIVDLSNPEHPVLRGAYRPAQEPIAIVIDDKTLFVLLHDKIEVVNLTDPAVPGLLKTIEIGTKSRSPVAIDFDDGRLYVLDELSGIIQVDVESISNTTISSVYDVGGDGTLGSWISVEGSTAVLSRGLACMGNSNGVGLVLWGIQPAVGHARSGQFVQLLFRSELRSYQLSAAGK